MTYSKFSLPLMPALVVKGVVAVVEVSTNTRGPVGIVCSSIVC